MADSRSFLTGRAAARDMKVSCARAGATAIPRTASTTSRTLRGDMRRWRVWALTSIGGYFLAGAAAAGAAPGPAALAASISLVSLPPWRWNLRVGANSPRRCPTMFSTTMTGVCWRPLWTPIVNPTISGVMTEARDHVLMTVLSPAFSLETFSMSLGSVNGPFFSDRLILLAALHDEFRRLLLALAGLDAERGTAPRGL